MNLMRDLLANKINANHNGKREQNIVLLLYNMSKQCQGIDFETYYRYFCGHFCIFMCYTICLARKSLIYDNKSDRTYTNYTNYSHFPHSKLSFGYIENFSSTIICDVVKYESA